MQRWTLSPRIWLVFLLTYASVALALDGWAISRSARSVAATQAGSLGATLARADGGKLRRIVALAPDSPLLAAGAAAGDLVHFDLLTDANRILGKSDTVALTLTHGQSSRHLVLSPSATPKSLLTAQTFFLDWAGNLVGLFCGVLLAIRRSAAGPHRVLALLLVTCAYGSELHGLPQPLHDVYFRFVYPLLASIGWLCFPTFAMVFPPDAPLLRRVWPRRLFFVLVAWTVVPRLLAMATQEGLLPVLPLPDAWRAFLEVGAGFACLGFGLAALWLSRRRSEVPSTRQAIEWIAFSVGLSYFTWVVVLVNESLGNLLPPDGLMDTMTIVRAGAYILLAYALLRRRLFDAGFVLNRALVVAVISTALLVIFAVTEFAVDKLLHFHGRETSVVIDAAVALGVILGFHRIQHWVNHQVNHFFFHHWHEAAENLQAFLRSASHISEAGALQDKFVAAICRFADATDAACYTRAADGLFVSRHRAQAIDANDDLVIALQHQRSAVEQGKGWALPMMLRGAIGGFVLIDEKRSGLGFRPDEIALLQKAAQQLSLDLESLRVLAIERERDAWQQAEGALRARCQAFEDLLRQQLAGPGGVAHAAR